MFDHQKFLHGENKWSSFFSTKNNSINENDNNEAQALLDWLVSLRHKGYTVIAVHHSGKSGLQRGASIIEVPMDYVIKLSEPDKKTIRSHDGAHFEFSFDKVRGRKPKPYKGLLSLRTNSDGVLQLCSDQSDNIVDRHYVLLKIFSEFGSLTHREVCKKLDISILRLRKTVKNEDIKPIYYDKNFTDLYQLGKQNNYFVAGYSMDALGDYGNLLTFSKINENIKFFKNKEYGKFQSITYEGNSGGALIYDINNRQYIVGVVSFIKKDKYIFSNDKGFLGNINGYFTNLIKTKKIHKDLNKYI
jgi:hypothetical protein